MNYISSIFNEQAGKFLVCKSPIEDFNDGSILTVNPGEIAIFINNGTIGGIFMNGRYELTTQNYPFINAFRRFMANGSLTYHCSVFFISETQSGEVLWGFSLPVRDPKQNIFTKVFVRGSYTVKVCDGGKLLLQLLGMNVNFLAAQDLKYFFGSRFQQYITNILGRYIASSGREVLELCADTIAVSDQIQPELAAMAEPYGLLISNFSIAAMQIDENDPNRRVLEQAYAKYREREILGDQYNLIKETDIRTNASQTQFAGMVYGTPLISGVPVPVDSSISSSQTTVKSKIETNSPDEVERLSQLAVLRANGTISDEEFAILKNKILQNIK